MTRLETIPWLADAWQRLQAYVSTDRVPQALLVTGMSGLGKGRLVDAFARRLLCREAEGAYACGVCSSCVLAEAGNHPDYLRVEPAEEGKAITVDAIRGLVAVLSLKPQYSGRRVVILSPAEQMNVAAANSLLKTLEEPDPQTSMLLVSQAPERLPATIRSRCQHLQIVPPEHDVAMAWLEGQECDEKAEVLLSLARGAPFAALSFAADDVMTQRAGFFGAWQDVLTHKADPVLEAERWHKHPCEQLVGWINAWTCDLVRLCAVPECARLDNPDLRQSLQSVAVKLELTQLFRYRDLVASTSRQLAGQVNRQMVLEELLIHWSRMAKSR